MDYGIYVLDYNLGILPFQIAVISADSSQKAEKLLKNALDSEEILGLGGCDRIGLEILLAYETGVKSDREKVILPSEKSMIELRANISRINKSESN